MTDPPPSVWQRLWAWLKTVQWLLGRPASDPAVFTQSYKNRRVYQKDAEAYIAAGWTQTSVVEHGGRIIATYTKSASAPASNTERW